jgi:hypothetical protein
MNRIFILFGLVTTVMLVACSAKRDENRALAGIGAEVSVEVGIHETAKHQQGDRGRISPV